jgi:hypothetical protein
MKMKQYLLVLVFSLLIPISALAKEAAVRIIPENFDIQGTVNSVNLEDGLLVVDDWAYYISRNTRVHAKRAGASAIDKLKVGSYIGFNAERGDSGKRYVHEIWVLPPHWQKGHPRDRLIPR